MSNKESRFGLRSREKLKLRSQKICKKCKRNYFPSSYSEYVCDIDNDEICNDCNAVQKAVKHSKPSLPSISQQSNKDSTTTNQRLLNVLPAFESIIPAAVSRKTRKTGDNMAKSDSTVEMAIDSSLSKVQTKMEFKGTIKFEKATKGPAAKLNRTIELSSVTQMISNDHNEENENVETNSAAISFESIPPLDPIDNLIVALPIDNSNNNRTKSIEKKKSSQKIIPKKINKNMATTSVVDQKKSLINIQSDEQICSAKISKTSTKPKCASNESPVTTRIGTRIRKKSVPFDLNWSSASSSNGHQEQTPPAKRSKLKRTSTNQQPNEINTEPEIEPEIEPVPIDQIKMELIDVPTNKVDIMNMVIVHSRLHPSKEKEITSSETLTVRPMDIKQEPIVRETNAIDLDIQQNDSINTLREKFPKASQYELEYLLFLSKGQK